MLCNHIVDMGTTFGLYGQILCVSEDLLSELLYVHIVDIETFGLHGLILCVSEGLLGERLQIHIVDIETFDFHELI